MTAKTQDLPEKIQIFQSSISKSTFSGLTAIYYFTLEREGTGHNRDRLLMLFEPDASLAVARNNAQLVQNQVQDQLFFPENMLEPAILRHRYEWWKIDPQDENSLVPDELQAINQNKTLIWGSDVLSPLNSLKNESPKAVDVPLSPERLIELSRLFPQYLPLLDPFICWQRHDFAIPRGKASAEITRFLDQFLQTGMAKHLLLYGRYWGSGKTGLLYWVMNRCKEARLPFIYRTEFWKDQRTGKYINSEWNDDPNTPSAVTQWIIENRPSAPFVLILDEVDFSPDPDLSDCLVIAAAKEIPQFVRIARQDYVILDLMMDYPFSVTEIESLIQNLMNPAISRIFPGELIKEIALKHHKWRFPKNVTDPAVAVRAASYSLAMAADRIQKKLYPKRVTASDVTYWLTVVDSPYIDHYAAIHDVHSEFFVFDGIDYIQIDPFNPGPLP